MPGTASPASSSKSRLAGKLAFFALTLLILAVDRVTKVMAVNALALGESLPLLPFLHVTLVYNRGAAFGLFQHQTETLILVAVVACLILVRQLTMVGRHRPWFGVCLSLLLAGALGNLIDRATLGYVIDFIDLGVWPVFNVADAAVTIGGVGLATWALWGSRR